MYIVIRTGTDRFEKYRKTAADWPGSACPDFLFPLSASKSGSAKKKSWTITPVNSIHPEGLTYRISVTGSSARY